jgi:hypothetical protein
VSTIVGPALLLVGAVAVHHGREVGACHVHERGRVRAEDQLRGGPLDRRRDAVAAELGGQAQAPPLAVPEDLVGVLERLRQRDGVGGRVEDRRVAVGVGEGLRQRTGRHGVQLPERVPRGLQVDAVERRAAQLLLHPEDLEEVELDVAQVAPEVAHGRPHSSFYRSVTTAYYSWVTTTTPHLRVGPLCTVRA